MDMRVRGIRVVLKLGMKMAGLLTMHALLSDCSICIADRIW